MAGLVPAIHVLLFLPREFQAVDARDKRAIENSTSMKKLDQIIAKLPPARRKKIAERAQELVAEEMALRHLRKARVSKNRTARGGRSAQ